MAYYDRNQRGKGRGELRGLPFWIYFVFVLWGVVSLVICRLPSRQRCSSLELSLEEYKKKLDRLFPQKLTFQDLSQNKRNQNQQP